MECITTLDLFCGAGGLTLGFKAAGFESIAAVEIDEPSVTTYSQHTPAASVYDTDACNVTFAEYRGKVQVVIGGPPCQPFSTGGLQQANDDHRDMVPEFIRAVEEVRPDGFVMENVPGLAISTRHEYLAAIITALSGLGYHVAWKVLHAEDFGVPQSRRRLFVVGLRDRDFEFPAPTHGKGAGLEPHVRVGDVVTKEPRGTPNPSKVFYARKVDLRPSPYHGLLFNGGGRALDFRRPSPTIISSAGGNKTHFVDCLDLVPEYHAYLMRGGKPREGAVPGCRRITVEESALLQSFPEHMRFAGPTSAQYRQVGNAVPPLLARAVAAALRKQMLGRNPSQPHKAQRPVQINLFSGCDLSLVSRMEIKLVRNLNVENAVKRALDRIDRLLAGENISPICPEHRRAIDEMLSAQKGSVRLACLFLLFYWLEEPDWNRREVPTGTQGAYGDKLLSEELRKRGITLHGEITAFGENLGWKGNVRKFDLSEDSRFRLFQRLGPIQPSERESVANYLAYRFAESRHEVKPLPPVGSNVLTFARAKVLLHKLIAAPSEGHIPQFLIAALLYVHRQRYGYEIVTHHPHASDKFDRTAGDIEERFSGDLVRAYEVTIRNDWQNRISDFKAKMDEYKLPKYVIIAADVNNTPEWAEPASALTKLEPYGRDIAVVDIEDVVNVFAAELTARELRDAINKAFDYISNQKLCGRTDVKEALNETASR